MLEKLMLACAFSKLAYLLISRIGFVFYGTRIMIRKMVIHRYRFTRHEWGMNSSVCATLPTLQCLAHKNPSNAGQIL